MIDSELKSGDSDSESGSIQLPHIVRVNSFNEESVEKFLQSFQTATQTGQSIIPVIIDSYGGDIYSLLAMVDIIRNCQIPVATIVEGKAMSCGAILFSCGTEGHRYMSPTSTLMIHDARGIGEGDMKKVHDIAADSAEFDRLNRIIYQTMAVNCGHKQDYFLAIAKEKRHADWYLDPHEAKKHNVCNHIGVPTLRMKVSVNYSLAIEKSSDVTSSTTAKSKSKKSARK